MGSKLQTTVFFEREKVEYLVGFEIKCDFNRPYLLTVRHAGKEKNVGKYYNERSNGPGLLIVYTDDGEINLKYNGETNTIKKGDFFAVLMRDKSILDMREGIWECSYICFYSCFNDELFRQILNTGSFIIHNYDPSLFHDVLDYLIKSHSDGTYDIYKASNLIFSLVSETIRQAYLNNHELSLAMKAKKYIDFNYALNINLNNLCSDIGVSKYHLIRTFHQQIGKTPNQYINDLRIERAKSLLIKGEMTNESIASSCGYNEVRNLYYMFKKKTGMTPKEFCLLNANKDS